MIDPSLVFTGDPSESLHTHNIEKLKVQNHGASIDQTAPESVQLKPFRINVDIKKGAVGEDEAHVQLGTWLTALYSRSRQLLPGKAMTMLPSLAVLSILGGGTSSAIGVYQVIAAIRRVAEWVKDEYRFWIERTILLIKAGGPKE